MKFKIEQIALCPQFPETARALLMEMGLHNWVRDTVTAEGKVFGTPSKNVANLSFNYEAFGGKELEILDYTEGDNWMEFGERPNSMSHIGMHVTAEELAWWRAFFEQREFRVAQEVNTTNHTNPVIAGKRSYNYVIFDTKAVLGVDVKFIVRKNLTDEQITTPNDAE